MGSVGFFGGVFRSFDASGWYGFVVALGTMVFGEYAPPVMFAIAVIIFLAFLTATIRFLRRKRR